MAMDNLYIDLANLIINAKQRINDPYFSISSRQSKHKSPDGKTLDLRGFYFEKMICCYFWPAVAHWTITMLCLPVIINYHFRYDRVTNLPEALA